MIYIILLKNAFRTSSWPSTWTKAHKGGLYFVSMEYPYHVAIYCEFMCFICVREKNRCLTEITPSPILPVERIYTTVIAELFKTKLRGVRVIF